jgi:PAS domain S-box-containing protein
MASSSQQIFSAANRALQSQVVEGVEAEGVLRDSEALLRGLFEYAPDAIVVVNGQGDIIRVNAQAEMIFGYRREELLGQPVEMLLPERFRARHLAHRRNYVAEARLRPMGASLELVGWRKDGAEFVVDIMLSPLATSEEGVVIAVIRDVTERKRAEAKHAQLAAIVESSDDAIVGKTLDGIITSWNRGAERIYGYTADEVRGQSVSLLVSPDYPDETPQILQKIRQGEVIEHYETVRIRKDGSPIHVVLTVSPIKDAAGNIVGASAIARDISGRKQVEAQLRASLREKETLLQEIHHRVKNNLQIISSLLKLQAEQIKDEKTLLILQESQHRIRSMALIHETLYQSSDLARVDFAQYIDQLLRYLFHSYGVKSSEIGTEVKVEDILLDLDTAIACGLVIIELVSNALKHAFPAGLEWAGKIRLDLRADETQIKLMVSDNGVGFPADIDFRQAESLGLQLVNTSIIDELEGTIELDRSSGTAFKITFPRSDQFRR